MDNKEIQRQRMMGYFIEAAKVIVKEEGVKGLTARKVGDRAGYSYATIYNYFGDLKELLAYCVFDFLEDCYQYMMGFKDDGVDCVEQILLYTTAYFRYFAQNSDMFQLIFLEDLGTVPQALMKNDKQPSAGYLLRENLRQCAKEGYIAEENVDILHGLIGASIHGKLLFFVKRRNMEGLEDVVGIVKREVEFLIKGER